MRHEAGSELWKVVRSQRRATPESIDTGEAERRVEIAVSQLNRCDALSAQPVVVRQHLTVEIAQVHLAFARSHRDPVVSHVEGRDPRRYRAPVERQADRHLETAATCTGVRLFFKQRLVCCTRGSEAIRSRRVARVDIRMSKSGHSAISLAHVIGSRVCNQAESAQRFSVRRLRPAKRQVVRVSLLVAVWKLPVPKQVAIWCECVETRTSRHSNDELKQLQRRCI